MKVLITGFDPFGGEKTTSFNFISITYSSNVSICFLV